MSHVTKVVAVDVDCFVYGLVLNQPSWNGYGKMIGRGVGFFIAFTNSVC